jgi:hypothetical protein
MTKTFASFKGKEKGVIGTRMMMMILVFGRVLPRGGNTD